MNRLVVAMAPGLFGHQLRIRNSRGFTGKILLVTNLNRIVIGEAYHAAVFDIDRRDAVGGGGHDIRIVETHVVGVAV